MAQLPLKYLRLLQSPKHCSDRAVRRRGDSLVSTGSAKLIFVTQQGNLHQVREMLHGELDPCAAGHSAAIRRSVAPRALLQHGRRVYVGPALAETHEPRQSCLSRAAVVDSIGMHMFRLLVEHAASNAVLLNRCSTYGRKTLLDFREVAGGALCGPTAVCGRLGSVVRSSASLYIALVLLCCVQVSTMVHITARPARFREL